MFAASGLAVASAGCLGLGDDDSGTAEASEGPATAPDAVRLQELSVQNNHGEAHRVQLAVEGDDEVLYLGNYELEAAGGSRIVEGDWNSDAGSYRVHARLDEGEIHSRDVTEGVPDSASCVKVLVRIDSEGSLAIWNGADCER
jgi:hypothetical protein